MSLFFFLVVLTIGWLLYTLYLKQMLQQGQMGKIKLVLIGLGLVFLLLAVTGRAPALFAVIGAAMTQVMRIAPLLIRFVPSLKNYMGGGIFRNASADTTAGVSRVATATLLITCNQTTGIIKGEVLVGTLAGRELASLNTEELRQLYNYCAQHDEDARKLLQTYITHERANEWEGPFDSNGPSQSAEHPTSGNMDVSEAKQLLGLSGEISRASVIEAHRSLMGKFHPDKGGNTYLAMKLNIARDVLLRSARNQ